MRIWHKDLLEALPDKQFKGQNRELVAIMRAWRDNGKTNHILINKVMNYDKSHLGYYAELYYEEYFRRYGKINGKILNEFWEFCFPGATDDCYIKPTYDCLFGGWHNDTYLRQCLYNLEEKDCSCTLSQKEFDLRTKLADLEDANYYNGWEVYGLKKDIEHYKEQIQQLKSEQR